MVFPSGSAVLRRPGMAGQWHMSERLMVAYGAIFLLVSLLSFVAWRIWYYAPLKVRRRNRRKDMAIYSARSKARPAETES